MQAMITSGRPSERQTAIISTTMPMADMTMSEVVQSPGRVAISLRKTTR